MTKKRHAYTEEFRRKALPGGYLRCKRCITTIPERGFSPLEQ